MDMDTEKNMLNKFKNFQDEIMKILQDTEKERDRYKAQVESLMASCDILNEELGNEQKDNITYRETIEDLKKKNEDLEEQIKKLEVDRQKLIEQLHISGRKNTSIHGNNEESIAEIRDVVNADQVVELNHESNKVKTIVDEKQQEDMDTEINDEITSIKEDYSFTTQFSPAKNEKDLYDELLNADSPCRLFGNVMTPVFHEERKNMPMKNDEKDEIEEVRRVPEVSIVKKNEKPLIRLIIPETIDTINDNIIIDSENEKTPEKKTITILEKSPILKDQSCKKRKNNSTSLEANGSENANTSVTVSPIQVVEAKYLLKPKNTSFFGISPAKRPALEVSDIFNSPDKFKSPKRNKTSPRRTPKKLTFQRTPKKSPARSSQLKKSHLIDAEKTFAGMKKLTQTKLNLDLFTGRKPNEKENQAGSSKKPDLKDKLRPSCDYMSQTKKNNEDDDLIIDSPQIKSKSLTDFQPKSGSSKVNSQPSETLLYDDPEATYVSSLFIRNWKQNQKFDDIPEERTPTPQNDLSPTERIPDPDPNSDSPPFPYRREAVRKKADRKKLPGHACRQCEEYYRSTYGDNLNQKEYQEMLNRCSRHRNKYPELDDTPPGFWKPYLTMTLTPEHN